MARNYGVAAEAQTILRQLFIVVCGRPQRADGSSPQGLPSTDVFCLILFVVASETGSTAFEQNMGRTFTISSTISPRLDHKWNTGNT